ncbi:MAG: hypothetical protein K0U84_09430 [Actinomycetia bacterium]|nr:hypothetical protein [Actinomycetes bacterium]
MNTQEADQVLDRNNGWFVIDIYCDHPSHVGGVYPGLDAISFTLDNGGAEPRWHIYGEAKRARRTATGWETKTVAPPDDVKAVIVGNRRIDVGGEVDPAVMSSPLVHTRYRLYCRKCQRRERFSNNAPSTGFVDETAVGARLYPILDQIALGADAASADVSRPTLGVARISLAALAVKLRSN